ncbi:DUF2793 domain-containing protein [Brevundimonas vesicularis]|uniref:DUF2793 domain-containing protein n=1 Tax=Brevundimonas vesicularis TaxID=41276 RepID=UPI0038D455A5
MSDDASARLDLPYLVAGQLQKHITLNEALTRLDVLVQTCVQSRSRTDPPLFPNEGALFILPDQATGEAWEGFRSGDLVRFEAGSWLAVPVFEGLVALILDEPALVARVGNGWTRVGGAEPDLQQLQQVTRLGLNTSADANNPFAARLNKALWTAMDSDSGGDGDLRFTFNKEGSGDVLSLLFQSNWGGRAELGLIGDDDLRLKVSPDGSQWLDALSVDRTTGRTTFARGAARRQTMAFTESGQWTPPAWAQWVEVVCLAGGGGGGAGLGGATNSHRFGGGGGGAGGLVTGAWPAAAVAGGLDLTVGHGGSGGVGNAASGTAGGDSLVALHSRPILRAGAGQGGGAGRNLAVVTAGAGGLGQLAGNAGGSSSIIARAENGASLTCPNGPGGGGAGGGVSNQGAAQEGGSGGPGGWLAMMADGGMGLDLAGGVGGDAEDLAFNPAGGGGGGGGGSATSVGLPGGHGGLYGAGGGGGGGGLQNGGAGGNGASGLILITAVG